MLLLLVFDCFDFPLPILKFCMMLLLLLNVVEFVGEFYVVFVDVFLVVFSVCLFFDIFWLILG